MEVAGAPRPKIPFKFLEPVNTPEKLTRVFEELLISDLTKDGVDHRKELNLTVTGLAQLLFLPNLKRMFPPEFPRDILAQALKDFMDNRWQNTDTGYWGTWYKIGDKIEKTNDLSITFHVVSYRQDNPPRQQKIADTTFSIRHKKYPYGWRDRGRQNNHHAYDVVRLLKRSWPFMTPQLQARSSAELTLMLARSLRLSLDERGEFYGDPYDSMSEAYYFGVSFLDEIGFLRPSQLFWISVDVSISDVLRNRIAAKINGLGGSDPMAAAALRKLMKRDPQ